MPAAHAHAHAQARFPVRPETAAALPCPLAMSMYIPYLHPRRGKALCRSPSALLALPILHAAVPPQLSLCEPRMGDEHRAPPIRQRALLGPIPQSAVGAVSLAIFQPARPLPAWSDELILNVISVSLEPKLRSLSRWRGLARGSPIQLRGPWPLALCTCMCLYR